MQVKERETVSYLSCERKMELRKKTRMKPEKQLPLVRIGRGAFEKPHPNVRTMLTEGCDSNCRA